MNDAIITIIRGVAMLLAAVAARYAIPWIKTHASAERIDLVRSFAEAAVYAIQQTHKDEPGATKKAIVKAKVIRAMEEYGISISLDQLDDIIESAVKVMKLEEGA